MQPFQSPDECPESLPDALGRKNWHPGPLKRKEKNKKKKKGKKKKKPWLNEHYNSSHIIPTLQKSRVNCKQIPAFTWALRPREYVAGTPKGLLADWIRDSHQRARGFCAGSPPCLLVSRRCPEGAAGGRFYGRPVGRETYINVDAFSLKAAFAYPPFQICFRKSQKKKRAICRYSFPTDCYIRYW